MSVVVVFMLVLVASLANGAWIYARLKNSHRDLWDSMGGPRLADSNISRTHSVFLGWLVGLKFLRVGDTPLKIACSLALVLESSLVILFVVFLLAP